MTALKVRNVKTDEEKEISVDGVFIAVGIVPGSGKFKDLVKMDESGYIIAGEDGVTSTPGIFAAGDIRTKNLRQVVTAVADGANAVASVQRYLMEYYSVNKEKFDKSITIVLRYITVARKLCI